MIKSDKYPTQSLKIVTFKSTHYRTLVVCAFFFSHNTSQASLQFSQLITEPSKNW